MGIFGSLIAGAVLALIASALRRGKSGMPWWGNWIAGIGGIDYIHRRQRLRFSDGNIISLHQCRLGKRRGRYYQHKQYKRQHVCQPQAYA